MADQSGKLNGGATPLYISAQRGHLLAGATLLTAGAAVDQANNEGATPLVPAVDALLAVEVAVDAEASKQGTPSWFGPMSDPAVLAGTTPLHVHVFATAWEGHTAVTQLLLDAGVDKAKQTQSGTTGEFAAWQGHGDIVALLQ